MKKQPWFVRLWRWLGDTEIDEAPEPSPAPTPIRVEHKIMSARIVPGRVIVINSGSDSVRLEGTVLRTLFLRSAEIVTVQSPLFQPIWRVKKVLMESKQEDGEESPTVEVKAVDREILWINEWDALEVVEDMIEQYARARAYDLMTPAELNAAQLPLTKEDLAPIIERLGLKAQRENENISTEA